MIALGAFLAAFFLSYLSTQALLRVRVTKGFVDVPNERSSHEAPKPRTGGVAIVLSFYAVLIYLFIAVPQTRSFLPFAFASGILFLTGVIDDWRGLGVRLRFGMQLVAVLAVVSSGLVLDHVYIPAVGVVHFGWFSIPLTCLFVLVCINFYNFIDGIDGLAAGSAFIATGFLALIAMLLGHGFLGLVFLAVAGSAVGFLQFNFPPSRLFMGDSGSTFLGFFFACAAITGNRLNPELPVFIPILILSSLFLDAGLTLFNRLMKKENIFKAHHTHYYQRLLSLGLNHKQVTLLEYGLVILLGVSAVMYFKAGAYFPVFLSVCWLTLFTLVILKIRGLERGEGVFWEKRMLLVISADLLSIVVAYLGAYFLRMNFRFTDPEGTAVLRALPIVLIVRSACFFKYGLYRSVWKYTSTADIVRIIKAVTMGSAIILIAVVLLYRFISFPRTLFIIEYFLLTLLVLGSRFSFRLFHEIGKEAHGANVRRFGVIGAGDFGERIGRELRNDEERHASIACFIDDDKSKIGLTLQGVPIAGPISRLENICGEYGLDELVVGISKIDDTKLREIVRDANTAGVVLEGRHGPISKKPESPVLIFERLRRGLGRRVVLPLDDSSKIFYRGKRVLITEGSARIGPALARELVGLGASVAVQLNSPDEAARFGPTLRDEIFIHLGPFAGRDDILSLLETTTPDVIFHCVTLDVEKYSNTDRYLWEATVNRPRVLCDAVADLPVSSIALLSFWEGLAPGSKAVSFGAVCEAMILNHPSLEHVGRKAVRFPRILDQSDLVKIYDGFDGGKATKSEYELLEPEAVDLALSSAAADPGSAVITPTWDRTVLSSEIRTVLAGRSIRGDDSTQRGEAITLPGHADSPAGRLFPAERFEKSTTGGAARVVGPVYPAGNALGKVFSDAFLGSAHWERDEWLRVLTSDLYQIAAPGVQSAIDD